MFVDKEAEVLKVDTEAMLEATISWGNRIRPRELNSLLGRLRNGGRLIWHGSRNGNLHRRYPCLPRNPSTVGNWQFVVQL